MSMLSTRFPVMSILCKKIDTLAGRVDSIDRSSGYVDLSRVFRHIRSIGRSDRHECDPGGETPVAARRHRDSACHGPYPRANSTGEIAMGNLRLVGWVFSLGLLVAACGGNSGDGPSVAPPPPSSPPPPAATPEVGLQQAF